MSERKLAGGVLMLLGAVALLEARRLSALREEMVAGAVVGDDTLPWLVGALLLALGGYAALFARWPRARVSFPSGEERRRLLASAGTLVAYYLATPHLGYSLATLLAATALYWTMGARRWWVALLAGAVTTAALYLAFKVWLLEPLPAGWLGI